LDISSITQIRSVTARSDVSPRLFQTVQERERDIALVQWHCQRWDLINSSLAL
jgi:hypothetical protein